MKGLYEAEAKEIMHTKSIAKEIPYEIYSAAIEAFLFESLFCIFGMIGKLNITAKTNTNTEYALNCSQNMLRDSELM